MGKEKLETILNFINKELDNIHVVNYMNLFLSYQSISLLNGQPLVTDKLKLFSSLHVSHHHVAKEPRALSALTTVVMPNS